MMKTAKTKTVTQPKKTTSAVKVSKSRKTSPVKYVPGEEEIREKAREIYFERIARGEHGTPEDDWREAEEILTRS
jgi:hypothetical protein